MSILSGDEVADAVDHYNSVPPITFDKIGSVACHHGHEALRAEYSYGAANTKSVLAAQPKLDVSNAHCEESDHGVV